MPLYYLNNKLVYLLVWMVFIVSCSSETSNEKLVKEFYDRAKQHETNLPIFFNVSFTARGVKDGKPLISRLEVALNENEAITLPGIMEGMTDEEIKDMPFFENISTYAKKEGLVDSTAYQEVKEYLITITNLAYKLEAYKIQSTPRLGKFIIFTLTHEDEVMYVPNISDVNDNYWKKLFDSGKKFDSNWYYRKTTSN
jgi:hypothetical protein